MTDQNVSVFISYSHKDDGLRRKLRAHLKGIGDIEVWDDRQIVAGTVWSDEIGRAMDAADIILLLLSSEFIASDFVAKTEIPAALQRHAAGTARVIPILLRPCRWKGDHLGIKDLQAFPPDEKWITAGDEWGGSEDKAFLSVVNGIEKVAEELAIANRQRATARQEKREAYRRAVATALEDHEVSKAERRTLDDEKEHLGLTDDEALDIEKYEGQPVEKIKRNLVKYRESVDDYVAEQHGEQLTEYQRDELQKRRVYLGLTAEQVAGVDDERIAAWVERREAVTPEYNTTEPVPGESTTPAIESPTQPAPVPDPATSGSPSSAAAPPAGLEPKLAIDVDDIAQDDGGVRRSESYSEQEAKAEIRGFLDANYDLSGDDLEKRVIDLHYFIERSHHVMNTHVEFAEDAESTPIHRATAALLEYLDDPHDLLPEAEWGYIGYLDDAWLIHNLAFRIQEAVQFDTDPFPVNWNDLIESDEIARQVLPDEILDQLEEHLEGLVGILFGDDDHAPAYFLDENRVPRLFMSGLAESGSAVRAIESYSEDEAKAEIREYLDEEFRFRRRGLEERVIDLHYFIERTPHVVAELREIAERTDDTAIHRAITVLCGYLDDPHDLLPEAEWGYIGYLDDAWLIHNFTLRIQQAMEYDPDPFPVDWDDLIESDEWVRELFPEGVLEQLEEHLEEFVGIFMS